MLSHTENHTDSKEKKEEEEAALTALTAGRRPMIRPCINATTTKNIIIIFLFECYNFHSLKELYCTICIVYYA